LRRRGWSERLIADELGPPDFSAENPHFARGARMLMYERQRVVTAEAGQAFQNWQRLRALPKVQKAG